MNQQLTGRVVVGTDGSEGAESAVRWASSWAARHNIPLSVAVILPPAEVPSRGGSVFRAMREGNYLDNVKKAARNRLDETVAEIAESFPNLEVDTILTTDDAAYALVEFSKEAHMVVVGRSGNHGILGQLGAVAEAVVTHAYSPTVVVPPQTERWDADVVTVGIDVTPLSRDVIRAAITEASERRTRLELVHAWQVPHGWGEAPVEQPADIAEALQSQLVDFAGEYAEQHPELTFETELAAGRARDVLQDKSMASSLLVIGARGEGGFHGLRTGSTCRYLVRHANCPVMVIRHSDSTDE